MPVDPARRFVATCLPIVLLAACGPAEQGPIDGERAMQHVEFLVKFGPRPAGSGALTQAADYIQKKLTELGLTPQVQRWRDERFGLELQNLWVEIPGKDPEHGPILVIGAHYDTKLCDGHPNPAHNFRFVGAIDGAGGPAVLLELARHLKDRANVPNIWLVWFDGEENLDFDWNRENDHKALLGSRHFVETMAADKTRFPNGLSKRMKAMVLIDLVGDKNPKIDHDITSDPELNEIVREAAEAMGEGARVFEFELASGFKDDHLPFKNYGVRAVDLIDFRFRIPDHLVEGGRAEHDPRYARWWHSTEDTPDKMSPFGLKFFGDLVWLALPRIERRIYGSP